MNEYGQSRQHFYNNNNNNNGKNEVQVFTAVSVSVREFTGIL
jgi:hypothetical protein